MSTDQPPAKSSNPFVIIAVIAIAAAIGGLFFLSLDRSKAKQDAPVATSSQSEAVGQPATDVAAKSPSASPSIEAPRQTPAEPKEPSPAISDQKPAVSVGSAPAAPAIPPAQPTAVVVSTAATSISSDGVLGGVVRLAGEPPPAREISPVRADRLCGALHDAPVMTRTYVVGEDRGLGNVVVSVSSDLSAVPFTAPTEQPLIDQVGCVYEPLIITVMTNQPFRIRNSDPMMHNINAQTRANRGFNFAQATKGQENTRVFPEPEAGIKLICNVHPWMAGYVWVFPHPFHTVTDKDGRWKFSRPLPPGRYEITFTHQKAGTKTATVEVTAAGAPRLEAELAVPAS